MKWRALIISLLMPALLAAQNVLISLEGHLSGDKLKPAMEQMEALAETPPERLVIEVESYSGDLQAVLKLSRRIYALKNDHKVPVVVYMRESVVGPGAILPFLADERFASQVVAWGDVNLGAESSMPLNLLRSRLQGLIGPKDEALLVLADAMIDPDLVIVDEGGLKIEREAKAGQKVVSPKGEALVLNQGQLEKLGLVKELLPAGEFRQQYERPESVEVDQAEEDKLAEYIHYDSEGENLIGRIEIGREGINQSTWIHVNAAVKEFIEQKPAFIILDLNTPGGEVFAAEQISEVLKNLDTVHGIPVVAFIDNWAISAGALLAYSCRFIATMKDGAMGAATPVFQTQGEMKIAPEKVISALRTDFANRAAYFDRDPLIAEAMVDKDLVLVKRHGEIVRLKSDEEIRSGGLDPDEVITTEGKLLTLTAEQMVALGVADFIVPAAPFEPPSQAERDAGRWPAEKSPLFQYPFFKQIPNATIVTHKLDWKTGFFAFLAHPAVASILFLGMMLGFYIEFNTPGFGLPGILGLVCLFFVVLASFSIDAASWLELLILGLGLCLLAIELFVLPGFGIAGVLGIIFIIVGLVAMLLPGLGQVDWSWDEGTLNAAGYAVLERLAWLSGAIIVGAGMMVVLSKYLLPKVERFSKLILRGGQEGYRAGPDVSNLPPVGSQGVARSPLRPAGKVVIEEVMYEASSAGDYLETGTKIRVARYKGSRMIVEEEKS